MTASAPPPYTPPPPTYEKNAGQAQQSFQAVANQKSEQSVAIQTADKNAVQALRANLVKAEAAQVVATKNRDAALAVDRQAGHTPQTANSLDTAQKQHAGAVEATKKADSAVNAYTGPKR